MLEINKEREMTLLSPRGHVGVTELLSWLGSEKTDMLAKNDQGPTCTVCLYLYDCVSKTNL